LNTINIVIGVSQGIGKLLFNNLALNSKCIGLTSKNNTVNKDIFYYPLSGKKKNIYWLNLKSALLKTCYNTVCVFLNSAIYDEYLSSLKQQKKILNINYFEQIILIDKIKNLLKPETFKIVILSSVEMFNENSDFPLYSLSKRMYYYYFLSKISSNEQCKLVLLGAIGTETYYKNRNNRFLNYIAKKLYIGNPFKTCKFLINISQNNTTKIYYYPWIYRFIKLYFFIRNLIVKPKIF